MPRSREWTIPNSSIDPKDPEFSFRKLFAGSTLVVSEWVGGRIVEGIYYHVKAIGVYGIDIKREFGWKDKYRRVKFDDAAAYFDPAGPGQRTIQKIIAPSSITAEDRKRWRHRQGLTRPVCTSFRCQTSDYDRMKAWASQKGYKHLSDALAGLMEHYEKTTGEKINGSTEQPPDSWLAPGEPQGDLE